ncbi:MAG: hypothetical protein IPL61_32235 [Myxococcales bacterium]|nr:hypothetical protein [Myxococcales bacterium]
MVGTIDVGRRGMFLRLGADARYVTGADRTQQALAAWVRTLVGDAYTPLLAEELTAKLGLKIAGLAGLAEDGEAMAGDRGGFGTTTAMVGLEVVRYLRDDRRLPLRLDDGRLRRLEHAVAVERAWITVYDQTKGAAAGGVVRTDVAAFPSTHRHWWVSRSLFIDIAWSLGAKVEALRVAMLAFDAHPSGAGTPSFDAQDQAMGALWDEFNRGADPLNATWRDATLRAHPGMHYLFPEIVDATAAAPAGDAQPKPPSGHAARVRFIEVCLGRYAALAARAVDDQARAASLVDMPAGT